MAPSTPVHIAAVWERYAYETYVGGVLTLSPAAAAATDGFPNNYWGWGGEDDEMYRRLKAARLLPVSRPSGPEYAGALVDLEDELIAARGGERAGTAVRHGGREAWRNMLKHELMEAAAAEGGAQAAPNGLSTCGDWALLGVRRLNADVTVVTVDLRGGHDAWAQRATAIE